MDGEIFHLIYNDLNGAPTRTRTADLLITNQLLYQLSYRGLSFRLLAFRAHRKTVSQPRPGIGGVWPEHGTPGTWAAMAFDWAGAKR